MRAILEPKEGEMSCDTCEEVYPENKVYPVFYEDDERTEYLCINCVKELRNLGYKVVEKERLVRV